MSDLIPATGILWRVEVDTEPPFDMPNSFGDLWVDRYSVVGFEVAHRNLDVQHGDCLRVFCIDGSGHSWNLPMSGPSRGVLTRFLPGSPSDEDIEKIESDLLFMAQVSVADRQRYEELAP